MSASVQNGALDSLKMYLEFELVVDLLVQELFFFFKIYFRRN